MPRPYAYARSRDPNSGDVILSGNEWVAATAPMAQVVAMTVRTQLGACAIDPGLGVDWRAIDRLAPGAAATAQHVIEQGLARYVTAGLIRAVSVATVNRGTFIEYDITYVDPRMPAARPRIRGAN